MYLLNRVLTRLTVPDQKQMSKQPRATYKEAILQSATTLFAEKGFKETSIAALSERSGAAEGTIFHHFKNKNEILLAILGRIKRQIIREVAENIEKRHFENGLMMVEEAINLYFFLSEKMETEFLLLFRNYPYQLANINPDCRKDLESIYNSFIDLIIEGIRLGQKDGSIEDMPAEKTSWVIFSMINGLVRFSVFNVFPLSVLYPEAMKSCRKILENSKVQEV